jgi:predicted SAM-dependent methyltransferase
MKRVNLGAGYDIMGGWVNVDRAKLPGIDVVHDLDIAPWPWETGSVDEIRAIDVFEHVDDPVAFMNQAGRVLKPGGILRIRSPHWKHENAYTDPTHKRYCTERTWNYWVKDAEFNIKYGAAYCDDGVLFEMVSLELTDANSNITVVLRRL